MAVPAHGSPAEVFGAFLKLGLTSFGGPVAHIGYFRDELVVRRKWIGEAGYADLVALCQFLPGPASSQVGFALGLFRAGPLGALAAFAAFTLPSVLLLLAFASGASAFAGPAGAGLLHGLALVAVAVVAQAVWGMAGTLVPDRQRAAIALAAVLVSVFAPNPFGQIGAILLGGLAGLWLCRGGPAPGSGRLAPDVSRFAGVVSLALFLLLLFLLPVAATVGWQGVALFDAFYRAGALVFGGGHVVLPLLEAEVIPRGWVGEDAFLAGYGAAQAVPGPLFSFAAYVGALAGLGAGWLAGAAIALAGIFLPGFLLLIGVLPFWEALRTRPSAQRSMRGANAAVVGVLGAALYDPVWTGAVLAPPDFALAAAGFLLLSLWKVPPWAVVLLMAAAGVGLSLLR
jgi:chromate transporter